MELGLISDIHANLPALEAVLDDMPERVDAVVCLGDIVGYNPHPAACVDLVREECDLVLQGNHDRMVHSPAAYRENRQAFEGLQLARERLSDEQMAYLRDLPAKAEVPNTDFLAVHSHPGTLDEYVMPKDVSDMRPYLNGYDGLLLGHTHIQHEAVLDEKLVLNPGSVGQSRDGNPTAGYAVVETETFETELRRTSYDIGAVIADIKAAGLPAATAERLLPDSASRDSRNPWRNR